MSFAVVDFDEDDEEFTAKSYTVVDSRLWRIEKRYYTKKDGTRMMYYNYRKRKGETDPATGKRVNVYRKGGKRKL